MKPKLKRKPLNIPIQNKLLVSFMLFVCLMGLLSSCQPQINQVKDCIYVKGEESFFSDFKVVEEKVYIYCTILVENETDTNKTVFLKASFEEDKKNGLLKEAILDGYASDQSTKTFSLRKGKNLLEVVFIGEHAGASTKQNRLLPEIQITELKQ